MSAISRTAGQDENIVRWTVAPLQLAFDMKKRVFLQHLSNAVRTLGMVAAAGLELFSPISRRRKPWKVMVQSHCAATGPFHPAADHDGGAER